MRIVFMGTPDFAAGALEALVQAGHRIAAAVTQPDKARGRSAQLCFSPVKECALRHGIPVLQPVRIRRPEAVEELRALNADVFVVAAFGQILSQEILDIPKWGCLNIHASLLPKYRGASPIQHVLLDGEKKTGITIMRMDAGIDTGDILYQKEIPIAGAETFETLHDRLMALGAEAIVEALPLLEAGKLVPRKQEDAESCYAPLISREMGRISFSDSAASIERHVRAMNPWPGSWTFYRKKQLKIWEAEYVPCRTDPEAAGSVLSVEKDSILISCGEDALRIRGLQLEGKKRMSAHDFLLGMKVQPGERLGE